MVHILKYIPNINLFITLYIVYPALLMNDWLCAGVGTLLLLQILKWNSLCDDFIIGTRVVSLTYKIDCQ